MSIPGNNVAFPEIVGNDLAHVLQDSAGAGGHALGGLKRILCCDGEFILVRIQGHIAAVRRLVSLRFGFFFEIRLGDGFRVLVLKVVEFFLKILVEIMVLTIIGDCRSGSACNGGQSEKTS